MSDAEKKQDAAVMHNLVTSNFMYQVLTRMTEIGLLHSEFYAEVPIEDGYTVILAVVPREKAIETLSARRSISEKFGISLQASQEILRELSSGEGERGH